MMSRDLASETTEITQLTMTIVDLLTGRKACIALSALVSATATINRETALDACNEQQAAMLMAEIILEQAGIGTERENPHDAKH